MEFANVLQNTINLNDLLRRIYNYQQQLPIDISECSQTANSDRIKLNLIELN